MLGAIVKSVGGKLAKQQVKKVAKDKLMGRKKKPTASKETAENMVTSTATEKGKPSKKRNLFPKAKLPPKDPQKLQAVQAEIDAKETDTRVVKISKDVTAIAEVMKSGLVLKDKAAQKERKAAEKDKRAAQESKTEKPKKPKKESGGFVEKIPGVGLLSGIFGFITKFLYGVVILKLIEFLPKLKSLLPILTKAGNFISFLIDFGGKALNLLTSAVDFGYKLVDGAEQLVGKIFGEEGAEKFRTFTKNFTTLINSFFVFKLLKAKVFDVIVRNIKNAFKFAKNIIKTAGKIVAKLFPNLAKGAGKIFQAGKGLVSKGIAKVGGFAAKIFGKAAGGISPAFKGAKPFVSKFFGKVPIVGPLVVTIVSLLSGEPAGQAIFKGLGAAVGGLLGSFIPIPIIGTLIGETIGVFVGDLLYAGLFEGGIGAVGQKLKDTFMTIFKGGKTVVDWVGGGIKAFINNIIKTDPIKVKEGFGVRSALTKGVKLFGLYNLFERFGFAGGKDGQIDKFPNLLNILNPFKYVKLLIKSFFGKRDETSNVDTSSGGTAVISDDENLSSIMGGDKDYEKNRKKNLDLKNEIKDELKEDNLKEKNIKEVTDLGEKKRIIAKLKFHKQRNALRKIYGRNSPEVKALEAEYLKSIMDYKFAVEAGKRTGEDDFKPVANNKINARIYRGDQNKAGKDADAVASETTYESGEGNAVIIPLLSGGGGSPMITGGRKGRGSGVKVRTVVVDDTELSLYGGK